MNRRQKKKNFKKKYGFNPPRQNRFEIEVDWQALVDNINQQIGNRLRGFIEIVVGEMIPRAVEAVEKIMESLTEAIKSMANTIQNMSEEEYQEFLEELNSEQRILVERIRKTDE